MSSSADLLSRYLEQRRALGGGELILEPEMVESIRRAAIINSTAGPQPSATGEVRGRRTAGAGPAGLVKTRDEVSGAAHSGATLGEDRGAAHAASAGLHRSTATPVTADDGQQAALVQIGSNPSLDALRDTAMGCVACGLARSRTTVVFGEGDPAARLVVVGEAPGADEDRSGRPFVGRAGKLLDQLLASIGFPRQSVYICNVLKCRPPGNRNPLPAEVEACSPFLRRQIEIIAPRAILAVGTFPAQTLLETTEPIGRLRGTVQEYQGVPLVPTYHPAALLRNPGWIRPVWEDLQRLRAVIDGRTAASSSS